MSPPRPLRDLRDLRDLRVKSFLSLMMDSG
jgi:hypothetical protein